MFSTQYSENGDVQLIEMKKFNHEVDNKYPVFSFCFKDPRFHWYHDTEIFDVYGLNATQYERMLKGETAERYERNSSYRSYIKTPVFSNKGLSRNFNGFFVKPIDFLHSLHFSTEGSHSDTVISNEYDWSVIKPAPIHLSFQSADRICFSRKSNDDSDAVRLMDSLTFNSSKIQIHLKTQMEVFVHYPKQLIASFGNIKYSAAFNTLPNYKTLLYMPTYQTLDIKLSEAKRIKKRHDSNKPCNRDIEDYDQFLKQKIGEKIRNEVGCVPIYLKKDLLNETKFAECFSPPDLKAAHDIISNIGKILDENEIPCDEMIVLTIDSHNYKPIPHPKDTTIRFQYGEKVYEEIQYVKAIGFESWLSNVGGFVGIFLGYSMMQFPEFLLLFAATFNNRQGHWAGISHFCTSKFSVCA